MRSDYGAYWVFAALGGLLLAGCGGGLEPTTSGGPHGGAPPALAPGQRSVETVGGEVCTTGGDLRDPASIARDDNGDGRVDEGCSCTLGATRPCVSNQQSGALGICAFGTQTCEAVGEFSGWSLCVGSIGPLPEVCGDGIDQDCDGQELPCVDDRPEGLDRSKVGTFAPPDYEMCMQLPARGKRGYGQCADAEVVVIVNDGLAQEMTCCPITGTNVLSDEPAEKHIARDGSCAADEVATGMADPNTPTLYCTKYNTKYLVRTPPVPSIYARGDQDGLLGQIGASYNQNDTCICPEGTIVIGGHTPKDNRCEEQCASLQLKE